MMEYSIASGPTDLLFSGIAFSYQGSPIEISFAPPNPLKLSFVFIDEPAQPNAAAPVSRLHSKVLEAQTLELTLFNFTSALGQGTDKPLRIGKFEGKAVFLHFRVYAALGADKELHFAFFQSKEPDAKQPTDSQTPVSKEAAPS